MPLSMQRPDPLENGLLAALPAADYARLLPYLELVPLAFGWAIYEVGAQQGYAYFPTNSVVSLLNAIESGAAEVAIVGNEGMAGATLVIGSETAFSRAVVLGVGYAYRLRANILKTEFERGGALQRSLLSFAGTLMTQMAQTAACNRHHSPEQRLCRWLLMSMDRVGRLSSGQLCMTQETIANMLGMRREELTAMVKKLQEDGLIRYSRGRITVVDRLALKTRACECYETAEAESDRLPESRSMTTDNVLFLGPRVVARQADEA